jgi:hypothetical protein
LIQGRWFEYNLFHCEVPANRARGAARGIASAWVLPYHRGEFAQMPGIQ